MKQRYRWQPARTWLGLIIYWLASMIGATILHSPVWIIFTMLVMVGICVFNPRTQWPMWKKIVALLVAWAAQAILQVLGLLPALAGVDSKEKLDRLFMFSGALPVVIYAMRQSRLFVAPKVASPEPTTPS